MPSTQTDRTLGRTAHDRDKIPTDMQSMEAEVIDIIKLAIEYSKLAKDPASKKHKRCDSPIDGWPVYKRSKFDRLIRFLQGKEKNHKVKGDDLRAWEYFVVCAGCHPAGAPAELILTISNLKKRKVIDAGNSFLARARFDALIKEEKYAWTPFRQLCLYSVTHIYHQRFRSEGKSFRITIPAFNNLTLWVCELLNMWKSVFSEIGKELAPYTYLDWSTLKITRVPKTTFAMSTAANSICATPQIVPDDEKCGFDHTGREFHHHQVYLDAADNFTESLYDIAEDFKPGIKFSESELCIKLDATIKETKENLRDAKLGQLVNGHLILDPSKTFVTPFSLQTLTFIALRCGIAHDLDKLNGLPFDLWPEEVARPVISSGILHSKLLLDFELARNDFVILDSSIPQAGKGLYLIGGCPREGIHLGSFYGIRIREDLSAIRSMKPSDTFGPPGYKMTKSWFERYAISATAPKDTETKQWIVPASFCPVAYANDPRRFRGNTSDSKKRTANAVFSYGGRESEDTLDLIEVHSLGRIKGPRTEIFIHYGDGWSQHIEE